jgi:IclR family acetate operon transcriptional repressor
MNAKLNSTIGPSEASGASKNAIVQSLQRGLGVLDALAVSNVRLTCKEIAELINVDRTITHRLLRTLEFEGFVEAENGRYQLAARALFLGNAYLDHLNLRRVALPHMISLLYQGMTDWPVATMSLFVPVGPFVTIAEQLWPPNTPLDIILRPGSRLAIDQTAAGRCVLANLPQAAVEALLGVDRAAALGPRLEEIRSANLVDIVGPHESRMPGVNAISALIRDVAGRSVAGLSVSGVGLGSALSRDSELAQRLRRTADQIGASLR